MEDIKAGETRLICYGWDGQPLAVIEMWIEDRKDMESQAVIVTLHSKVMVIKD